LRSYRDDDVAAPIGQRNSGARFSNGRSLIENGTEFDSRPWMRRPRRWRPPCLSLWPKGGRVLRHQSLYRILPPCRSPRRRFREGATL